MLLKRAKERRVRWQVGSHLRDPALVDLFGGADGNFAGVDVTPTTAMQQGTALACTRIISETFASIPLFVMRRGENGSKSQDPGHPLYAVLHNQPNRWQTSFEFREYMMHSLLLRGFAAAEIFPDRDTGYPFGELVPLHPDRVYPFRAPNGDRAYWYMPDNGPRRVILQQEMLYIPFLPGDGYNATSIIRYAAETIGAGIQAQRTLATLFKRNLRPGGILKAPPHKPPLSSEAKQELRASWEERHSGPENQGRLALLEEGWDFQAIAISPGDAKVMEDLKWAAEDIARVFLVKPHKVNIMEHATFSNIEHQAIEWVVDTIRPWCVRWEQAMLRDLFTDAGRRTHFAEFELDGLLRGDIASRYQAYALGRQWGFLSVNMIARKENIPEIGPEGDVFMMPMNMTVATPDGMSMTQRAGVAGALFRGGWHPDDVLKVANLPPMRHVGLGPVTLRPEEEGGAPVEAGKGGDPDLTSAERPPESDARVRMVWASREVFVDAAARLVRRDLAEVRRAANRRPDAGEFQAWLRSFETDQRAAIARIMGPPVRSLMRVVAIEASIEARASTPPDIGDFIDEYVRSMTERIAAATRDELSRGELGAIVETWRSRASAIAARELAQAGNAAAIETFRRMGVRTRVIIGQSCVDDDCRARLNAVETHPPLHEGCDCIVVAVREEQAA